MSVLHRKYCYRHVFGVLEETKSSCMCVLVHVKGMVMLFICIWKTNISLTLALSECHSIAVRIKDKIDVSLKAVLLFLHEVKSVFSQTLDSLLGFVLQLLHLTSTVPFTRIDDQQQVIKVLHLLDKNKNCSFFLAYFL